MSNFSSSSHFRFINLRFKVYKENTKFKIDVRSQVINGEFYIMFY